MTRFAGLETERPYVLVLLLNDHEFQSSLNHQLSDCGQSLSLNSKREKLANPLLKNLPIKLQGLARSKADLKPETRQRMNLLCVFGITIAAAIFKNA